MMVWYLLGASVLVLLIWLGLVVKRIGAVSRGDPIAPRSGTALLLIDLQTVFWEDGPFGDADKQTAKAAILEEIAAARAQNLPIIAVRQEWSIPSTKVIARLFMKGQAIQGTAGTEVAEPFAAAPDHVVVKRVQDAFETGELDALLDRLGVGTLRLVGLDRAFCVQKTALAARNRGYEVVVIKRGTLSAITSDGAARRMTRHGIAVQ